MFKLIGFYINENQKTYVNTVLSSCDSVNQKESQSAIDNSLCEKNEFSSFPVIALFKNNVLTRYVVGKYPINIIKSKLLI
tara:strand:- start:553 stop:792 length:240 start_codon:yes stop_codon:yes gene_type:complete